MKQFLADFSLAELAAIFSPEYRAKQIFEWFYRQYGTNFDTLTTVSKALRSELSDRFETEALTIAAKQTSVDGSEKYLFRLADNHTIETVLLLMREGETNDDGEPIRQAQYTVCVSTQVGCKMGCAFCMTAKNGFVRNLTAGEIVSQVLAIKRDHNMLPEKGLNIVYMGMGEPLDNLASVAKATQIFATEAGLSISPRRQTISTSGISPKIDELGEMNLGVLLAISLHAVDNATRERLIPLNKAFNIESVIAATRRFPIDMRKRVMFEYLMIDGVNDDPRSAKTLVRLLGNIRAKVNLIAFNPHEGSSFARPDRAKMEAFQRYLLDHGIVCTIRQSRGIEIDAACGQLRERHTASEIVSHETISRESIKQRSMMLRMSARSFSFVLPRIWCSNS
ncbi:dual-specificity RNA methyltransferase RlmN [Campylobacterota bacterium]|nr:dual-specificity RNA methyltransferase RlmN [Campylobacterota bacterium]